MEKEEILAAVDHTLLRPCAAAGEIQHLCNEAVKYHTATVCVPPCYVRKIKQTYGDDLTICTVVGFPLGYNTTAVKVAETQQAVQDGAGEIDMVVNLCMVKNGEIDAVRDEIAAICRAAGGKPVKVILETCYLTTAEKIALCTAVREGGAQYIKTSTGFGTAGATMEDVQLFKRCLGDTVKIKAAGGIRTREEMEAYLEAGCSRIGTSSAITLLAKSDD